LRYGQEHIEAHRANVIRAIQNMQVELREDGPDGIAVFPQQSLPPEDGERLVILLEELSVQNEALEYQAAGFGECNTIGDLRNSIISHVESLLPNIDLVEAYNIVTISIPQIVRDIRIAHLQNKVLSPQEVEELDGLASYAQRTARILDRPGGVAQGGSAEDVKHGFLPDGTGAIVNSSRGIIYAGSGKDWREEALKATQEMAEKLKI